MPQVLYPLVSQAAAILPVVRGHIVEAAGKCNLPIGFSLDMVPILEEDLFGYELTPLGAAETCLTLGCKSDGEPVLRKECLTPPPLDAPRLASVNGRPVHQGPKRMGSRSGRRDFRFSDWASAAKFACDELESLFPGAPRRPPMLNLGPNASLERALLAVAIRLAQWNPFIHFCGLPNEEQLGYALSGTDGGRGELMFRHPDRWTLHWKSTREVVHEAWTVVAHNLPLVRCETSASGGDRRANDRRKGDRRMGARVKPLPR
jgi:hypothetical protein